MPVRCCADGPANANHGRTHRHKVLYLLLIIHSQCLRPCLNSSPLFHRTLKSRPHMDKIPIIVVTAEVGEDVRVAATEARASGFIEKPAKIDELMETLRKVIVVNKQSINNNNSSSVV